MEDADDDDEGRGNFVAARSLSCHYVITENRALRFCRDCVPGEVDEDDRPETIGEWTGEWSSRVSGRIFHFDDAVRDLLENGRALGPMRRDVADQGGTDQNFVRDRGMAGCNQSLAEDHHNDEGCDSEEEFHRTAVGSRSGVGDAPQEESWGGADGEESEPQENQTPKLDVESVDPTPMDYENKPKEWPGGDYKLIDPVHPKQFNICEWRDTSEYLIFLAIRQKVPSTFQDSAERAALNVDANFNRDYLVTLGFRHIPMLVVALTPEQVRGLNFLGELPMTTVYLERDWAEQLEGEPLECSVGIKRESQEELRRLLARVDGLPPIDEDDGDLMCNRVPLFCLQRGCQLKNGPERRPVGYDVREEFRNLRARSYNWWCVVGSSLRVKEVDAPFDNFRVLGDAVRSRRGDDTGENDEEEELSRTSWSDYSNLANGRSARQQEKSNTNIVYLIHN